MTIKNNQLEDAVKLQKSLPKPATGSGKGAFYTATVGSITEGMYVDSNGVETQITSNGQLNVSPSVLGEVNTASNVGIVGEGLFKQKSGVDLQFKRIKAGSNVALNVTSDFIEVTAVFPPTTGEANTASNIGLSGLGLFKDKSGVDLRFRRLIAGSNVTLTYSPSGDEIIVAATGGGGASNTFVNIGVSGEGVYSTTVGSEVQLKKIRAGTGVTVTSDSTGVIISAAGASSLSGLTDCLISSPIVDQLLKWNGTKWVNATVSGLSGTLSSLSDVTLTSPSNLQVLQYNSGLGKWINATVASTLATQGDVTITSPANNQLLKWNSSASKWVNGTITLSNLTDCVIASPVSGQVLRHNGITWENATVSLGLLDSAINRGTSGAGKAEVFFQVASRALEFKRLVAGLNVSLTQDNDTITINASGSGSTSLSLLTDCLISSPSANQLLRYNSGSSKWENATVSLGLVDSGSNRSTAGAGKAEVFYQLSGRDLQFKRLVAGTNITLSQDNDTVTITASGSGGASALNDLTDVTIASATSGQFLRHNGTEWVNQTVSLGLVDSASNRGASGVGKAEVFYQLSSRDLQFKRLAQGTNVTLTQDNDTITIAAIGSGASALDDLTDVVLTTPANGEVLKYNGTQWVNGAVSGGGLQRYQASSISGEEVWVLASGTGVTYSRASTVGTFSIPSGVQLISARLRLPMGTIGGTSFTVSYGSGSGNGAGDNTSAADSWRPNVQGWREDTGAQLGLSIIASTSNFDRVQINSLATGQTCNVKLSW